MSTDLSHYLGMFRRHWWVVLLLTAIGAVAAALVTQALPRVYQSATSVLVQPAGQDTNVVGGRTKAEINLDTEAQLVGSTAVAAGAAQLLRSKTAPDELARGVKVEVPPNTSVLVVRYEAAEPAAAQAGSHAFAAAYLRNREQSARAELNRQIGAITAKIKQLNATLIDVNNRLPRSAPDSALRGNLESQRNNALSQLNGLTGKLNELSTATVGAGKIISDARLPSSPSSPDRTLNLATGVMLGLLAGLALAVVRERLDRRIRTAGDVRLRARIPVLAALDERTVPRFDDVLQPYGPGGRVFNRLRNEVLASLRPADQIIVVTGATRGPATTLVAANLAAALARTGAEVALIGAHLPDTVIEAAPLARIFSLHTAPGLSELLAGRVGLPEATQWAPRIPTLRVITTGAATTAGGLMQSQGLRDTLEMLRGQVRYIVIEAPSTASSADAQSLASIADAAILAVELRRARRPDLLDATEQLHRVATPLLGAVALPRLPAARISEAMAPVRPALPPHPDAARQAERHAGTATDDRTQQLPTTAARTQPLPAVHRTQPLPPAQHTQPLPPVSRTQPLPPPHRTQPLPPPHRTQPLPPPHRTQPLSSEARTEPLPLGTQSQPLPSDDPTQPLLADADRTAVLPSVGQTAAGPAANGPAATGPAATGAAVSAASGAGSRTGTLLGAGTPGPRGSTATPNPRTAPTGPVGGGAPTGRSPDQAEHRSSPADGTAQRGVSSAGAPPEPNR